MDMKRLLTFCCMVLLILDAQSCNITVDSIVNENSQLEWPWTITVDSSDGSDSENCLIDQTVHCKTLDFVLNNMTNFYTQPTCLKLVLVTNHSLQNTENATQHTIPYSAQPLSGISLYFVGEQDALITCENSIGTSATAWSIQNATFVVFKSLHFSNCDLRLEIANVTDVYFENIQVNEFSDSGLRLFNNFNVTLKNLSIVNCSHQVIKYFPENSALSLVYRSSGHEISHVQIINSQFHYNSIKLLEEEKASEGVLDTDYPGRGGALGIFINEPIKDVAVNMIIDECNFTNNTADAYGGAIYLTSNKLSSGHNFTMINSVFDRNYAGISGGGFAQGSTKSGDFNITTVFISSHYYLDNCSFTQNSAQYGGGVSIIIALNRKRTTDTVSIDNCIFDGNIGSTIGAAVMISSLTVPHLPEQDFPYNITNCTFKHNISPNGILGITFKDLEFYGTNHFIYNHGPSITATDSIIAIRGTMNFSHNVAENFDNGVIHLQDFVQFQLHSGSHMYFHNNSATIAAVFVVFIQDYPRVYSQLVNNPWCFLLHEDTEKIPSTWTDVSITFDNNTAFVAPNMYISNFDLCSWQNTSNNQVYFSDKEVLKWPVFDYRNFTRPNARSSEFDKNALDYTVYTESVNRGINTAAQSISGTKNYTVRPGQQFVLDLVPRDVFGNPTIFVFGFSQFTKSSSMPLGRVAQYIDLSTNDDADVVLEPNIIEYSPYIRIMTLKYSLDPKSSSLKNFTVAAFAAVKFEVSDVPVTYIDIMVDKCLPGQTLRKANSDSATLTCECDFSESLLSCESDEMIILRDGFIAFDRPSQIFSSLQILPCPPTYCQCRKGSTNATSCDAVYNYTDEEQQCHPDREGVLCGECRYNHQGVGVLTMLCQNCDNYNVIFVPILVLLDVILVILILCSATPFPPSLKGILFYVQAMPQAVALFPLSTWRGTQYMLYISSALSLYFPWDFCLYEGMTALASHFFTYFPFIIAVVIITVTMKYRPRGYTSPQGKKFQEIYQKFRSKCAHGIWTLLLLMFLRVSYNAWLITECLNVADNGLRWYYNGNVQCFNDYEHILLFLFGVIVILFTSGLMLFIGLLTIGALDIITDNYATWKHLCESASYGYKETYQWWPLIDLGRRFVLMVFWISFPTYTTLQIFIFFVVFVAHIYAQPYEKAWHNWLETFLLVYIIVFLLLRSTNFIIDSLLPNTYAGIMLPRENMYDRMSPPAENPLPPSDALTYFFVPLLYLPLTIALIITGPMLFKLGKRTIVWLYNMLLHCFQKCKASQDTNDVSEIESVSIREYRHSDSGVLVTRRNGCTTKVPSTIIED